MRARFTPILLVLYLVLALSCSRENSPVANGPNTNNWLAAPTEIFPDQLSQFGAFVDLPNEVPAAGVIPYEVRYPLFVDYNEKSRYIYLPAGKKIDSGESWVFPIGTAFFKTFYLTTLGYASEPRQKVETRVLHKGEEGWSTGTYQWNESGDEAFFTRGKKVDVSYPLPGGKYDYEIPGRRSCLFCHESMGDFIIGFEEIQLQTQRIDGSDQWAYLRSLDLFTDDSALGSGSIAADGEVEREALGYLHANCANCHLPGSATYLLTPLDMRHTHLKASALEVAPVQTVSNSDAERIIKKGAPELSTLYLLMSHGKTDDLPLMPPIGRTLIDTAGLNSVRTWIEHMR